MAALNSYIESILNPDGRFRTLRRVVPVTDSTGYPVFTANTNRVSFSVRYNGAAWSLHCPLDDTLEPGMAEQDLLLDICNSNAGHIAPCRHYPDELVVFDDGKNPERKGVLMCLIPDGLPLPQFVRANLFTTDRKPLRELLRNIAAMAAALSRPGIVNIKAGNIIIPPGGHPVIKDAALNIRSAAGNHLQALVAIAAAVFISGCEPELYRLIGGPHMFTPETIREYSRQINAQAGFSGITALKECMEILAATPDPGISAENTLRTLDRLAATPFAPMPLLANILSAHKGGDIYVVKGGSLPKLPAYTDDPSLSVDFSKCDFVGDIHDTLIRFRENGMWGYATRDGMPVGSERYMDAEDFYEGRAKVLSPNGYGLIDRDGTEIMKPGYELREWHGPYNVATACHEGSWHLYDRMGRRLTSEAYDWMSDPREGFIITRRSDKYGYINLAGEQAIPARFDEAYSFENGKATVAADNDIFHIDTKGDKIL